MLANAVAKKPVALNVVELYSSAINVTSVKKQSSAISDKCSVKKQSSVINTLAINEAAINVFAQTW